MRRVMLLDRNDAPLGELAEGEVLALYRHDEVNGERSLTVTTTRELAKGTRIVTEDARGKVREHVVYGEETIHESSGMVARTYYCVWSLQHDLIGTRVSRMPGVQSPVTAQLALEAALSGTSRWTAGTVTRASTGGASMYDMDGWSAMGVLVATWGGELDATISVGVDGTVTRSADLYETMGEQQARRRFDFGADIASVRRTVADGPLYCRITPRGKGEETESGGYGRRITIEDVNDGKDYLENPAMVELAKLPDGEGGWEYPTLEVENSDCETPEELLEWAQGVLVDSTTPEVTYEVDVVQLAREGVDMHGVSLGDAVHVVDRKLGGLRVSARAVAIDTDMLDEASVGLVLGSFGGDMASLIGGMETRLAAVTDVVMDVNGGSMAVGNFVADLVSRLNATINAAGGYWYMIPGLGTRTYDRAVSDPAVGAEATAVVEIRGGSIRIANSRTAQGDWEWKSLFTAGHISAELVTAANIVSGSILADVVRGGTFQVGGANNVDGIFQVLDADGNVISVLDNSGARITGAVTLDLPYNMSTGQPGGNLPHIITENDYLVTADVNLAWNLTGYQPATTPWYLPGLKVSRTDSDYTERSYIMFMPYGSDYSSAGSYQWNSIVSKSPLVILGSFEDPSGCSWIRLLPHSVELRIRDNVFIGSQDVSPGISINETRVMLRSYGSTWSGDITIESGTIKTGGPVTVYSDFSVRGTKSREAETDHYGDRRLYSYETPAPMFGDVGSGTLDGDGLCYVEVDDVFSETARTDFAYQVFLQKCGAGDLWVAEKAPGYFVVEGTPGLAFDWEIKARQAGFENIRMEDGSYDSTEHSWVVEADELEGLHGDYVQEIEQLLLQETI